MSTKASTSTRARWRRTTPSRCTVSRRLSEWPETAAAIWQVPTRPSARSSASSPTSTTRPARRLSAALNALNGAGQPWVDTARERYAALGRQAAEALGLPAPKGSTFLFPDVSNILDDRGLDGFLGDLAEAGVLVAPGPSFGPYPGYVRLCFTAAPPDEIRRGVEILASHIRR